MQEARVTSNARCHSKIPFGTSFSMTQTSITPVDVSHGFQVRWVFGGVTEALRNQLIAFWLREGALSNPDEAWARSFEVACVLQENENDHIAGVCTVAIRMDPHHRSYGFVRMFSRPGSRLIGLKVCLIERMIEGFTKLAHEPGAPHRLVLTIENRKLERRAAQRILGRLGFVHIGTAANGELVMQRALTT
jgi:hypothetical protein